VFVSCYVVCGHAAFRTKWDLQSIDQAIEHDGLGVRVLRVAKDQSWAELLMNGPPGSFYEGTPLANLQLGTWLAS
jgi:hypothetical protein